MYRDAVMPCLLLFGPAGSGKTTLARALERHVYQHGLFYRVSTCNLDPGTVDTFSWDVDVRTMFTTRQIMDSHGLGPNGAVSKSYDLLTEAIEALFQGIDDSSDHLVIVDTPGQLDPLIFSNVGATLISRLARRFPCCIGVFLLPGDLVNNAGHHAFLGLVLAGLGMALPIPLVHVVSKADAMDPAARTRFHDPGGLERTVQGQPMEGRSGFFLEAAIMARRLLPIIHPVFLSIVDGTATGLDDLLDLIDEASCACGDLS